MKKKSASKNIKKPNIPLRRKLTILYMRVLFIIKVIIICFFALLFFTKWLDFIKQEVMQNIYEFTADIGFRFENVLIEGQHNTTIEDIIATLNADRGTPIFSINLNEVQNHLSQSPWIKAVAVERRLPNTIYIALLERMPIAIWQVNQRLFIIDDEGYKITDQNIEKFAGLLHVVGADANIYASRLINDLAKYPELAKKVVSAVRYSERRWNLNLQQNLVIKMPEEGFEKALDYLASLHKTNKLFDQNYKALDMRNADKHYLEKQ